MRITKNLPCLVALTFAIAFQVNPMQAQEKDPPIKIGLVDMERIFGEFYKTKLAEDEVQKVKDIIKVEVAQRKATHAAALKIYDGLVKKAKDPTLSETVRKKSIAAAEAKGAELRTLDGEMQEYSERRRKQLIEQVEKSKAKLTNEITARINEISTADGYDAVFDKSGLGDRGFPFVVFVKDATDLSPEVIESLNADAPKTATSTADPE